PAFVPSDPPPHGAASFHEAREAVLPDALLLQAAEEALHDPVLLRGVGRDELLAEPVVPARGAEPTALEDEPVVRAYDRRRPLGPQRPEPLDARGLESPLPLLGAAAAGELVSDQLAVMAVDHGREVRPAVRPTVDVRQIHRPAFVTPTRATAAALHPGPRGCSPLMDEPAFQHEHAVH